MSETHFQTTSQAIVDLAAMALSAAPGLTEPERAIRFQTVVQGAMELQPADPAQTILGTLILGHHLAIMDGFRDLACLTLTPAEAARARMVTVAQTKLVLQLLREMRIERKDALTRAADDAGEPATGAATGAATELNAGAATCDAALANYVSAYNETMAALENAGPLTPAAAAKARETLSQVMTPALFATHQDANPVPPPLTGSRAQRRAMMKRNGGFKRHV